MKHRVFDVNGALISETEVPDPPLTPEEQIVALQDAVDSLTLALLELEP